MSTLVIRTMDQAEVFKGNGLATTMKLKRMDIALLALLAFLLITSLFIFHVWSRLYVFRLGYDVFQQENVRRELLEESKRLTLEITSLRSPARIEKIAREELKLRPAKPDQIVLVNPEDSQLALVAADIPRRD